MNWGSLPASETEIESIIQTEGAQLQWVNYAHAEHICQALLQTSSGERLWDAISSAQAGNMSRASKRKTKIAEVITSNQWGLQSLSCAT